MSEETKQPNPEETEPVAESAGNPTPGTQKTGPEPKTEETGEKTEKEHSKKESKKKEKCYTLTREQMEAAELAAKQLDSVKDQFVRLTAEYENYRKRTAKEKETIYQDARADTVKEFLAVYDNLERAMTMGGEDSPHKKGLEMIYNQYQEILKKLGVTKMDAKGQPFDPNKHNAIMHVDDETLGENVVADVLQAGFMLGDKVLRFATVRVAN